ncbi:hypothetical protein AEAC466_12805 [Asticcacaulis sp. AC466]|nr:hypothetical protein AEAC466_12805 [Asticcacaulis sp. AC466]
MPNLSVKTVFVATYDAPVAAVADCDTWNAFFIKTIVKMSFVVAHAAQHAVQYAKVEEMPCR